jgi:hypothetical protein
MHRMDEAIRTRKGRRDISRRWREERAFDFNDMNLQWDCVSAQLNDLSEINKHSKFLC